MSDRIRYLLALVVGLLAIPGLAFATSSALSSDESEETSEVFGIVATATTADPSAISAEDLVRACGVEGHYLVELEAVAGIDDIQQAALNALRPICDEAGLPLPAAPIVEGETIVETVTVVRTVPGSPAAATKTTDSTTTTSLGGEENDAEALSARQRALDAINRAIEVGGNVERINKAIALVERGDAAREAGDYDQAEDLYEAAEDKALEAQQELEQRHEDDDHEDDDHEDDDHDHDHDHEDDDHEDDD
jgi:tetratricopeptide (TPR) repeat protein